MSPSVFDRADDVVVVELRPGELGAAVAAHDALTERFGRLLLAQR